MKKIYQAVERARKFLIKNQKFDGSWAVPPGIFKEPDSYFRDLFVTANCIYALVYFCTPEAVKPIMKGINFCANAKLEPHDIIDLWCRKLDVLKLSTTPFYRTLAQEIAKYIATKHSGSYWKVFTTVRYITNAFAITSLRGLGFDKIIKKTTNWLLKNPAKDGKGWGNMLGDLEAQSAPTGNVINVLLNCGTDPSLLLKYKDYLEKIQQEDGGWTSSKLTYYDRTTTYSTAVCAEAVMRLSEDPFNKCVKRAVKFLLEMIDEKEYWPLYKEESMIKFYPTYYALRFFSFYLFLRQNWQREDVKLLRKAFAPQKVINILHQQWENSLLDNLEKMRYKSIINSKVLGATKKAINRRIKILQVLEEQGAKDTAGIIDALKKHPEYGSLNKKSHLTQIKSDVDYLKELNIIGETRRKYFIVWRLD